MEDATKKHLSVILRRIMAVRNLDQTAIAAELGTTQSTVSRILTGNYAPRSGLKAAILSMGKSVLGEEDTSDVRAIIADLANSPELESLVRVIVARMHKSA
jgi:predicted transcriptional regulator